MSAKRNKREKGFTLIELISVIIILGILAAVITPKYFDMTTKAQQASYDGALSEGTARLNMAYATYILTNNAKPAAVTNLNTNATLGEDLNKVNIGDFDLKYAVGTPVAGVAQVDISVMKKDDTVVLKTKTVPWPQ